jgi:hypothetical protein
VGHEGLHLSDHGHDSTSGMPDGNAAMDLLMSSKYVENGLSYDELDDDGLDGFCIDPALLTEMSCVV